MNKDRKRILIIQTAFIGDVILATCLIEYFRTVFPGSDIDFVTKSTNKLILKDHPHIQRLILWDKSQNKLGNLKKTIEVIRETRYDYLVNVHRFGSSGLMSLLAKARHKIGYDKNPFSFCYDKKVKHQIGNGYHEVDRLMDLVQHIAKKKFRPKLHLAAKELNAVKKYQDLPYLVIAPNSVWFTKQYPVDKWVEFINNTSFSGNIFLIGSPDEYDHTEKIVQAVGKENVVNLCGELTLPQSAALISGAVMNYTNDSGPMHLCTATNSPVKAIYCSTTPDFGFGPLSDDSTVIETEEKLSCRPCGLHGHSACPEGHFRCAGSIRWQQLEIT